MTRETQRLKRKNGLVVEPVLDRGSVVSRVGFDKGDAEREGNVAQG
jgi:hypothetical protein